MVRERYLGQGTVLNTFVKKRMALVLRTTVQTTEDMSTPKKKVSSEGKKEWPSEGSAERGAV